MSSRTIGTSESTDKHSNGEKVGGLFRRILICLCVAVAALVALECILRFGLGLGNPVLVTPDAACDYVLKPNQNIYRFFATTSTNRFGMRSPDFAAVRPQNTLRLMFVGDSLTYGTSRVDQHGIFTDILRRDLPTIVRQPVEVLNVSAGNWAIDNELSFIRSRGIFQSNVVLLVVNDDDLKQPRANIAEFARDMPVERPSSALGELYTRYLQPFLSSRAAQKQSTQPDQDAQTERNNLAELDAFRSIVSTQGAVFVLVFAPFVSDIPKESGEAESAFQDWAAAHQTPFLDLTADEASHDPGSITLDGMHLNARGNMLVAQAIERSWQTLVKSQLSTVR
jgi:hypothetical protein